MSRTSKRKVRSDAIFIEAFGERNTLTGWCDTVGLTYAAVKKRLAIYPPEIALDRFEYFCDRAKVWKQKGLKHKNNNNKKYPKQVGEYYFRTRTEAVAPDGTVIRGIKNPVSGYMLAPKPVAVICGECGNLFHYNLNKSGTGTPKKILRQCLL